MVLFEVLYVLNAFLRPKFLVLRRNLDFKTFFFSVYIFMYKCVYICNVKFIFNCREVNKLLQNIQLNSFGKKQNAKCRGNNFICIQIGIVYLCRFVAINKTSHYLQMLILTLMQFFFLFLFHLFFGKQTAVCHFYGRFIARCGLKS